MWVYATNKQNKEKTWLNLALARRVTWSLSESHTIIAYDSAHSVIVVEKPAALFDGIVSVPNI